MRRPVALAAAALFAAVALQAAEAPQPAYYVLHQEIVKPANAQAYEQATKEFISVVQQHREASPAFNFTGFAGTEYVYSYTTRIPDFATLDKIYAGFGALAGAVGEARWNDLMKRSSAPIEFIRESLLMEDPALSYAPAQPRLKPEDVRYFHFDLYFVQPGREAEADAIARDIAALFRKKGVADGYRMLKTVLGPDTPLLTVVIGARDAADFATQDAAVRELLGAEGQALFARAFALTRRFEQHNAWLRPDLSLPPVK